MKNSMFLAAAPIAFALAACSQPTEDPASDAPSGPATPASAAPAATPVPEEAPRARNVLALEGLGDLVIGEKMPATSTFKLGGAQASDSCLTYASADYPGVYAIVEEGTVRRITIGQRSQVKLVEGIGVGSTEAEVLAAFPGFVASPHEYVGAPAKYLTQPGKDPRLMFEIGEDGKVTHVHAGLMPQLAYVEGCA